MEKKAILSALAALSQETRLDVFRLLVQVGPEGLSAGAIAEALGVAPNTLSFHLAQLNHAGLIVQRRESRSLIYSADYGQMNALMGFLTENCCGLPANAAACGPACAATPEAANTGHEQTGHGALARPRRRV
jgi:ArsR family transcriptional regulator, arsenate/arsenite/antimonite-responsive transcriptional repressor